MLERTDFVRFGLDPTRPGTKEWHHFVVHGSDRRIIVNFSICSEESSSAIGGLDRPPRIVARIILIVKDGPDWTGSVETFEVGDFDASSDGLRLRIGRSEVRLRDGNYEVDIDLPSVATGRVVLRPRARPFVVGNHGLGPLGRLSWLLLPRLEAHGHLMVNGRRLAMRAAPAYHDHNWGAFRWGEDFGWEWGSALPSDPAAPWSIVFMRMTDQSRLRATGQGMYVWHHHEMAAMFRDATTTVAMKGFLSAAPERTLPGVMRFLTPGRASGIPAELQISGRRGPDQLEVRFVAEEYLRIAIPSEIDLRRVVTLNEISGRVEAHGMIDGTALSLEGSGVFELLI